MLKEVKIELTNKCSRNCVHCSNEGTNNINKTMELSFKDVVKIIKECSEIGVESIVFTGGEPLQYKNLHQLIKITSNYGIKTTLYTFEYRTEESFYKYRRLIKNGLSKIVYSLADSLSQEKDQSLYSLETFFESLLKDRKTRLGFHYALTKDSYPSYQSTVNNTLKFFLNKDYFDQISFLRFVPHGRGEKEMRLSPSQLLEFKSYYLSLEKEIKNKIRLGSPWNILAINNNKCLIANEVMIIGFDGIAYPCDAIKYYEGLKMGGNIKEKSLKEMYNSKYFIALRELFLVSSCASCYNQQVCQGGCLGQKIIAFYEPLESMTKSLKRCYLKKDPQCLKRKE